MQKDLHDALTASLGRSGSLIGLLLDYVESPVETASNSPTFVPGIVIMPAAAWGQLLRDPEFYIGVVPLDWILATGVWNDAHSWDDDAVWVDSGSGWLLASAVWADSGQWDDSETWNDEV